MNVQASRGYNRSCIPMRTTGGAFLAISVLISVAASPLFSQSGTIAFEFSKVVQSPGDTLERAVAFHSLAFIDEHASPIDEILFATPEADSLQESGWFGHEFSPEIGGFQWAGGPNARATMNVTIPSGTEGILVSIKSIEDTMQVRVLLDDSLTAQFRVDSYWRSSYIPVGGPRPVAKPDSFPVWTEGEYFPRFPAPGRVYVLRVRSRMNDWQFSRQPSFRIDDSFEDMTTLSLLSMQGIINRSMPSVYIQWGGFSHEYWRERLSNEVETVSLELDGLTAMNFLMRKFGDWFSGAVIYDPGVSEQINLATMIAGLEDRVILAPAEVSMPGLLPFGSYRDLRPMASQNGWDTTAAGRLNMYQWVYDSLWSQMDHRVLGIITAGPPTSGILNGTDYFPLNLSGRDYLIALKLSALSLDVNDSLQANLLARFLDDCPSPIPVTGTVGLTESQILDMVSERGSWMAAMTWPRNIFSAANMTIFSALSLEPVSYVPQIDEDRLIASLSRGATAALFTTDGDPFFYDYEGGFRQNFSWQEAQGQRLGWTINPVLSNLAPLLWNDYVHTANGTGLVCAVSGAGYIKPWKMDDTQLGDYLERTRDYLLTSGLRVIHIFEDLTTYHWEEKQGRQYAEALADAGYLGAILGYGPNLQRGLGFYYTGAPTPTARTSYLLNSSTIDGVLDDLAARKAGEEFHDFTDSYGLNQGIQFVADSGASGGTAVLIPKDFFSSPSYSLIVSVGPMSLAPGRYQATLRMKVAENVSSTPIVNVSLFYGGPNAQHLRQVSVHPSDFSAAGVYQDIPWSFTLDTLTTGVFFWFDYGDGATDLSIDYIHAVNTDGTDLPVAAMVVIDNINPLDQNLPLLPAQFVNELHSRGGTVLTPDEFMAALNPRYMLDLAKQYLGTTAATDSAAALLNNGEYLASLLVSRKLLRDVPVNVDQHGSSLPAEVTLHAAYPNPFNPSTTIRFDLPSSQPVVLAIFNMLGERVATIVDRRLSAGSHEFQWDARGYASGLYIYRLETPEVRQTKKLLFLR